MKTITKPEQDKYIFSEGIDYSKTEKTSILGKLVAEGLKTELKAKVIGLLKEAKLTIREAAELLGVEYWEMQQIMEEKGVPLIDITEEEIEQRQDNQF